MAADTLERIQSLAEPVVAGLGMELVQVELRGEGGGRVLRVTIDKSGGVTLADCERVSRDLDPLLDVEDAVPGGGYTLEVASPGLDRPLVRAADFERFAGRRVRIRTRRPPGAGERRNFAGELVGMRAGTVVLRLEGDGEIAIQWENMEEARLAPTWPKTRKPGH